MSSPAVSAQDERLSSDSLDSFDSANLLPSSSDLYDFPERDYPPEPSPHLSWRRTVRGIKKWLSYSPPGEESFARAWRRKAILGICYLLAWYIFSLALSFYNTWLFHKDRHNFKFPLFTTMIHMLMQFALSAISVTLIWPSMRPTRHPKLKDYFTKVLPCGVATGMDIGLSNSSLKVITLSFYTMVKSAAPVFVLLFAFMFGLERPTWALTAVIMVICSGVVLMVTNEVEFNVIGYAEVQIATILSGLRWALTQILLERRSMGMNNPLATNLFLAPIMAFSLLIACAVMEGFPTVFRSSFFSTATSTFEILSMIALGGIIAFFMVVSEFFLISTTSVVTFSIAGILKEIITLLGARHVYGDEFPPNKVIGLIISISGIALYNYVRLRSMRKKHKVAIRRGGAGPLVVADSTDQDVDEENVRLVGAAGLYGFHPVNAIPDSDMDMELAEYEKI